MPASQAESPLSSSGEKAASALPSVYQASAATQRSQSACLASVPGLHASVAAQCSQPVCQAWVPGLRARFMCQDAADARALAETLLAWNFSGLCKPNTCACAQSNFAAAYFRSHAHTLGSPLLPLDPRPSRGVRCGHTAQDSPERKRKEPRAQPHSWSCVPGQPHHTVVKPEGKYTSTHTGHTHTSTHPGSIL